MSEIERIGVSLDKELLSMFDKLIAGQGYKSRSEAIRDLVRKQLSEERARLQLKMHQAELEQHQAELEQHQAELEQRRLEQQRRQAELEKVRVELEAARKEKLAQQERERRAAKEQAELLELLE